MSVTTWALVVNYVTANTNYYFFYKIYHNTAPAARVCSLWHIWWLVVVNSVDNRKLTCLCSGWMVLCETCQSLQQHLTVRVIPSWIHLTDALFGECRLFTSCQKCLIIDIILTLPNLNFFLDLLCQTHIPKLWFRKSEQKCFCHVSHKTHSIQIKLDR